ncbi:hypothetical protein CSB45_00960 [candidate division KSB3 bacterium]|uniref:Uncharacterized protein n=1 Tax=candidate division KSB3 bacterium TaxID=2044937 RepID=A0A2G6EBI1_9BACT|nr:MAG: hypothetical protein CSB45_00960 [candidate division KSB3 bacterium]
MLQEIADLAALGYVKKTGCPDRDCSPAIWAKAMEEMVGKRDFLSLPMPNHNYLKKVAWDLADQADLAREKTPVKRQPQRSMASNDPLQAAKDRWDREHAGQPVIIPGIGKIEDIVKGVK